MKTALVTGGNSGIGKETAKGLVKNGFRVFIASRNVEKSQAVIDEICIEYPEAQIAAVELDLSDLEQVKTFAEVFKKRVPVLDVLILNAGIFALHSAKTKQGFESQIGINHLGHFLLTKILLETVLSAHQGRIIVLSSIAHWWAGLNIDSFKGGRFHNPVSTYGQSKLANLLFAKQLADNLAATPVLVNAVHPGMIDTDIMNDIPSWAKSTISKLFSSPEVGAESSIFLATSPDVVWRGELVINCKRARCSPWVTKKSAELLWQESERLIAPYL
jgi:retinol dehydrogenase-14